MSATQRRLEFEIDWLDLDPTKDTIRIVTLSARARAWLDHVGVQAVVARLNAMGRSTHKVGDALQDLLEHDVGNLTTNPDLTIALSRDTPSEFAVEYADATETKGDRIATICGLTPRARGWLGMHSDELAWRISMATIAGEPIESVCQRLLHADLGPLSENEACSESCLVEEAPRRPLTTKVT
jgi:hypothetical protein